MIKDRTTFSITIAIVVAIAIFSVGFLIGQFKGSSTEETEETEETSELTYMQLLGLPDSFSDSSRVPITLALSIDTGSRWHLSVNSAGQAEVTFRRFYGETRGRHSHKFEVTEKEFGELRDLIFREEFFELDNQYGVHLPDDRSRTMTISVGAFTKTVEILDYMNLNGPFEKELRLGEAARAVRIWRLVCSWLRNVPSSLPPIKGQMNVMDGYLKIDQALLEAVKSAE